MVPRALGTLAWPRASSLTAGEAHVQLSSPPRCPVWPPCGTQLLPVGEGLPGARSQLTVPRCELVLFSLGKGPGKL